MQSSSKKFDTQMALLAGDSFFKLSNEFVENISDNIHIAKEQAVRDVGGIISSATNLTFSIEIYIKGLMSMYHQNISEGHDLWKLYKKLPIDIKKNVEHKYNEANKTKDNVTAELHLKLSLSDVTEHESGLFLKKNDIKYNDYTLPAVLKRNKSGFTTWRYLYEIKPQERIVIYVYEFGRLIFIAKAIRYWLDWGVKQINSRNS